MRNYIFTERERQLIDRWLKGEITGSHRGWTQLVYRIRSASQLISDIELFLKIRSRLTEPKTT